MEIKKCALCGSEGEIHTYRNNKGGTWVGYISHRQFYTTSTGEKCPVKGHGYSSYKEGNSEAEARIRAIENWNSMHELRQLKR